MYSSFEILYLAIVIDSLSYTIGTLLYGSPIPVRGLKEMGHKMIVNSIYVAVLANIFGLLLSILSQFQKILGVNWSIFYLDIGLLQIQTSVAINMGKFLYGIIVLIFYYFKVPSQFYSLVTPLLQYISFLTDILILLNFYMDLGLFIQSSYMVLIAIGILLMALPFQMGKGIGAMLIAFTIVFYVGLPLLPILISNSSPLQNQNFVLQDIALQTEEFYAQIPALFYSFILIPLTYMGVLVGFSFILQSFIGGYIGKLPIPVEI